MTMMMRVNCDDTNWEACDCGLDSQFRSSPMSSLCVVSNCVIGTKTDPLWDRTILALFLSQDFFHFESLVRRHYDRRRRRGEESPTHRI